eukprot:Phypoly_transcript_03288.p1 GENE.Phypoly_transcript_03288~~Phypoly_transcript_03288.p1  ORF type:complete len:723 (+),score=121.45 Phypoly_transcript_03288:324-2492(+)
MDVQKRATCLYQNLTLIPTIDAAYFLPPPIHTPTHQPILIKSSQTDVGQAKKRTHLIWKTISEKGKEVATAPFPLDITSAALVAVSPSGSQLAIVRIEGDKKDEPFIEIWDSYRLVHNVSCKGKHSSIYTDEWFGSLEWSPDEKYVAYVAEPSITSSSFWDKDQKDASKLGHKFDYREDWGEGFIGLASPSIFLLEVATETITAVKLEDRNLTVGQVIWSPNGKELVFVGWPLINRRLGIRFCYNRDSAIYHITLEEVLHMQKKGDSDDKSKADATSLIKLHLLSDPPKKRSARFPRFSPDGSTLVYLAAENLLTHNGGTRLLKLDWKTHKIDVVLDVVARQESKETFPGIFVHWLPRCCFIDNHQILTHTQWCSTLVPIVIDLQQKKIQKVPIPGGFYSAVVHDVVHKSFLLVCSSPTVPPTLVHGTFESQEVSANSIEYSIIHKPEHTELLHDITFICQDVTPTSPPTEVGFEVFLTHPKVKQGETLPLLVFPHGGPHVSFTGEYSTYITFLALMGYAVLSVNYRGSIGFGTDFLNALPGRCGELDVQDCVDAARMTIGLGLVDPHRIGVVGGSHGGFLAAHLIGGTFEELDFKVCVMRNPVINIVGMSSTSDIPDWCFVETGSTEFPTLVANLEQYTLMYNSSPIRNINKIKTPTLILLGEVDKRVPTSQGLELHHALIERNVPSKVQFYQKNGHGLVGADADPDQAVNTVLFLNEYLH